MNEKKQKYDRGGYAFGRGACACVARAYRGGGRGAETYCYSLGGKGQQLATCIQRQLVESLQPIDPGYRDRGVMEHPTFCVLRNTNMPAVLVEVGFIDSDDVGLLTLQGDDIARALARGVTDYWQRRS